MNHQQYETWLFAEEPLLAEQKEALRAHLSTCTSCQLLQDAWFEIERELAEKEEIPPAPGFVHRWQARLATEEARSHQRQGLAVLAFSGLGMVTLLAMMVGQWAFSYQTPAQFFLAVATWFASLFSLLDASFEILEAVVRALPGVFLIFAWIGFAGLGGLSALWVVSFHQFAIKRRVLT